MKNSKYSVKPGKITLSLTLVLIISFLIIFRFATSFILYISDIIVIGFLVLISKISNHFETVSGVIESNKDSGLFSSIFE